MLKMPMITLKATRITILFFVSFSLAQAQNSENCTPDKGIKTARIFAKLETPDRENDPDENEMREIHYDSEGRPTLIRNSRDGSEHRREYIEGKLQMIITVRKDLPDFYLEEEYESLIANAPEVRDSAMVVDRTSNGEVKKIRNSDESMMIFDYAGCREESQIFLAPDGDTIQLLRTINENGVTIKTVWTPFEPVRSDIVTLYHSYKFNQHGHWTSREVCKAKWWSSLKSES